MFSSRWAAATLSFSSTAFLTSFVCISSDSLVFSTLSRYNKRKKYIQLQTEYTSSKRISQYQVLQYTQPWARISAQELFYSSNWISGDEEMLPDFDGIL